MTIFGVYEKTAAYNNIIVCIHVAIGRIIIILLYSWK